MTELTKPKITRLEDVEELEALMPRDVVEIENIGEALFYPVCPTDSYAFYSRWGGISINKIIVLKKNTSVKNGSVVIKRANSDLIWPHDSAYKNINEVMEKLGI